MSQFLSEEVQPRNLNRPRILPINNRRNRGHASTILARHRTRNPTNSIFQADRDFNADDYEVNYKYLLRNF